MTKLQPGTVVEVLENRGDWCKIAAKGRIGFVQTQYLVMEAGDPVPTPTPRPQGMDVRRVKTTTGGLNLRKAPDVNAVVLKVIPKDQLVQVLTPGNMWCQVVYQGMEGYVMTKYLTAEAAPAETSSPMPTETNTPEKSPAEATTPTPTETVTVMPTAPALAPVPTAQPETTATPTFVPEAPPMETEAPPPPPPTEAPKPTALPMDATLRRVENCTGRVRSEDGLMCVYVACSIEVA